MVVSNRSKAVLLWWFQIFPERCLCDGLKAVASWCLCGGFKPFQSGASVMVSNRSRAVCPWLFKTIRRQCFCGGFNLF